MAYKVVINKRFINKLVNVLAYLEKEWGKKVADDFLLILDSKIDTIQSHPFSGGTTGIENVRGFHITKHNRLFYKIKGKKITILNLYDTRRKDYTKKMKQ